MDYLHHCLKQLGLSTLSDQLLIDSNLVDSGAEFLELQHVKTHSFGISTFLYTKWKDVEEQLHLN